MADAAPSAAPISASPRVHIVPYVAATARSPDLCVVDVAASCVLAARHGFQVGWIDATALEADMIDV